MSESVQKKFDQLTEMIYRLLARYGPWLQTLDQGVLLFYNLNEGHQMPAEK
jgi:hypothetical protein